MTDQLAPAEAEPEPSAENGGRRARVSRWDRPPQPRDWRYWVGGLGKVLIVSGLLMFGFVGYQLWGTGIETARAQRALEDEFEELVASYQEQAPPETAPPTAPPTGTAAPTTEPTDTAPTDTQPPDTVPPETVPEAVVQDLPPIERGAPIARLEIPKIDVDVLVVPGVEVDDLKKGPGHFPNTPLPGQLGNAAIAGHRTTYGSPFFDVDQLEPGDELVVTMANGEQFVYEVTGSTIVAPSDSWVIQTEDPTVATLTLTSCDPAYTARNRIVIFSELRVDESADVGIATYYDLDDPDEDEPTVDETVEPTAEPTVDETTEPVTDETGTEGTPSPTPPPAAPEDDAFAQGWFHDKAAFAQIALWAAALIAITTGAYLLARHFRRTWLGVLAAVAPFLVALYFFYQNVNRLLPPGF